MPCHLPFSHKFLWLCESHVLAVCWHHVPWVPSTNRRSQDCSVTAWAMAQLAFVHSPFLLSLIEQILSQIHYFGSQETLRCCTKSFKSMSNFETSTMRMLSISAISINAILATFPGYLEQCLGQCKAADPWHQIMDCPLCSSTGRYSSVCRTEDFQHGLGVLHYWGPSGQGTSEYMI